MSASATFIERMQNGEYCASDMIETDGSLFNARSDDRMPATFDSAPGRL